MKFMNHQQFAEELGLSRAELYRRIKKHSIKTAGGLLSPKDQMLIRKTLGFPYQELDTPSGPRQNETE